MSTHGTVDESGGVLLEQLLRLKRDWHSLNERTRRFHRARLRFLWALVNGADPGAYPEEEER